MYRIVPQLLLMIIFSSTLYSQLYWKSEEKFERNVVIVKGEAIREVPADFATFDFSVRGTGKTLQLAVRNAREKIAVISDQLHQVGLDQDNLATTYFRSGENYEDKAFLSAKRDYVTEIKVLVGIDSLELLEPSIIAVSSANPENMSDIKFELKNRETLKTETVGQAVTKAKEKALKICRELGLVLGTATYIEELSDENANLQSTNSVVLLERMRSTSDFKSIYAETVEVKAKVRVVFNILSKDLD